MSEIVSCSCCCSPVVAVTCYQPISWFHTEEESDTDEDEWEDFTTDMAYSENLHLSEKPVSFMEGDVCIWKFPAEFCQSSINGCNGSNACSIISLAVTHAFLTGSAVPPAGNLSVSSLD